MIQRRKAKRKKTWKEWLFSLTFSNDEFFILLVFSHFISYSQLYFIFYFSVFHLREGKKSANAKFHHENNWFWCQQVQFNNESFIDVFFAIEIAKKQNQTLKRILFLVWICGYRRVSREVVLLVYLHHRNIFRCFGVKN